MAVWSKFNVWLSWSKVASTWDVSEVIQVVKGVEIQIDKMYIGKGHKKVLTHFRTLCYELIYNINFTCEQEKVILK